jgi:hypothetical protein
VAAWGDFDLDGDLDPYFPRDPRLPSSPVTAVWTHDGSTFTSSAPPGPGGGAVASVVADFDGDGDPDVAEARANPDGGDPEGKAAFIRNNSAPGGPITFAPRILFGSFFDAHGVVTFDAEGDGDADLLFGAPHRHHRGDGAVLPQQRNGHVRRGFGVRRHDGDFDFLAPGGGAPIAAYWNLTRHVGAQGPLRLGRSAVLSAYGQPGEPWILGLAASFLEPPLALPPFGNFHLDPASTLIFASGTIPAGGRSDLSGVVPAGPPSLAGVVVPWQGVVGSRFVNAFGTPLVP